jgi:hypothetical protein
MICATPAKTIGECQVPVLFLVLSGKPRNEYLSYFLKIKIG